MPIKEVLNNKHFYEILSGSFWAFFFRVIGMISGYASILLISNYFGVRTVGLFNLSSSVIGVIVLISSLGFPTAILRFAAEFKNNHALQIILKKMVVLSFIVSLSLAIIFFFYSDYISSRFFHNANLKDFLHIMLIGTPFIVVCSILIEFIRSLRLIKISESFRNSVPIFNLFLILFLIFIIKSNNLTPAFASTGAILLVCLITSIYTIKKLKSFHPKKTTLISYKKILSVSSPMLITNSMFLIISTIDKIMLGFFKTSYEVGIYSVAIKLASVTSIMLVAINTILAPKFSEFYWSHNLENLKKVARFSSKITFYSSALVLIIYFLFSHQILSSFGKEFVLGSSALIILSIGEFINSACGSVGWFLNIVGGQIVLRNIIVSITILNIFLNYLLIPKYGYDGAAFATALSAAVYNIIPLFYIKIKYKIFTGYLPFLR